MAGVELSCCSGRCMCRGQSSGNIAPGESLRISSPWLSNTTSPPIKFSLNQTTEFAWPHVGQFEPPKWATSECQNQQFGNPVGQTLLSRFWLKVGGDAGRLIRVRAGFLSKTARAGQFHPGCVPLFHSWPPFSNCRRDSDYKSDTSTSCSKRDSKKLQPICS